MPSVALYNGRYVGKNRTSQTISRAISWRLARDLQSAVPAMDRLLREKYCIDNTHDDASLQFLL